MAAPKDQPSKPDTDNKKQQSAPSKKIKSEKDRIDATNDALYRYYRLHKADHRYYEQDDRGKFKAYCGDSGIDEMAVNEDMKGTYNDSQLIDMDDEFPDADSKVDVKKYIFDTIKECWECPDTPWAFKTIIVNGEFFRITDKEQKEYAEEYKTLCPAIWDSMANKDHGFLEALSVGMENDIDYLQMLVDDFHQQKIRNIDDPDYDLKQWRKENQHFRILEGIPHQSKTKKDIQKKADLVEEVVKAYGSRCVPALAANGQFEINDSLEIILKYIQAEIFFVSNSIAVATRDSQRAVCPFQFDLCIAVGKPINKEDKDDDDDDDDGDIPDGISKKAKANNKSQRIPQRRETLTQKMDKKRKPRFRYSKNSKLYTKTYRNNKKKYSYHRW